MTNLLRILTLLISLLFSTITTSQWSQLGGLDGGRVLDIAQNESYIFAGTLNGLFKSNNNGELWEKLILDPEENFSCRSIGINNDTIVVFATNDYENNPTFLFRSTDNGSTWEKLNSPSYSNVSFVAISDFAIYLNNLNTLWFSIDNGNTWQVSSLQSSLDSGINNIHQNEPIRMYNNQMFVGSHNKIYRSETDSDNWSEIEIIPAQSTSYPNIDVIDDSIYIARPYLNNFSPRVSFNNGNSWIVTSGIEWGAGYSKFVKVDNNVFAQHGKSLAKSTDLGSTWTTQENNNNIVPNKLLSRDNNLFASTSKNGVNKMNIQNSLFEEKNLGIEAGNFDNLEITQNALFGTVENKGIYTYDLQLSEWSDTSIYSTTNIISDLEINGDSIFFIENNQSILFSSDNGIFWNDISPMSFPSNLQINSIDVKDSIIYVWKESTPFSSGEFLLRSPDLGANWDQIEIAIGDSTYLPNKYAALDSIIYAATDKLLFKSIDNSLSWEVLNIDNLISIDRIFKIIPLDSIIFCFLKDINGDELVYASYDDGINWVYLYSTDIVPNMSRAKIIQAEDKLILLPQVGFFGSAVFSSTDNGLSWFPITDELFYPTDIIFDDGKLFLSTSGRGVFKGQISDFNLQAITGHVYFDENDNSTFDLGELPFPLSRITLTSSDFYVLPDSNGFYSYLASFNEDETVIVIPQIEPDYVEVNPSEYLLSSGDSLVDFGIFLLPDINDLKVSLTHLGVPRPGFESSFIINFANVGTTQLTSQIVFELDDEFVFINSEPMPSSSIDNTLIWDIADLEILEAGDIEIDVLVPQTTMLNTQLNNVVSINSSFVDQTPDNNVDTSTLIVVGSFDPNDKMVKPSGDLFLQDELTSKKLEYTIRFQNTGSFQADKVRLLDQISSHLNLSTFEVVGSSHDYTYNLRTDGLLEVIYDMINLPDSTTNESESHGFFKYAIAPKSNLTVGDSIENQAAIFFDFNEPILTNKVVTNILDFTNNLIERFYTKNVQVFPNPSIGRFSIIFESEDSELIHFEIINSNGNVVFQNKIYPNEIYLFEENKLPSGIYFIRGTNKEEIFFNKILLH